MLPDPVVWPASGETGIKSRKKWRTIAGPTGPRVKGEDEKSGITSEAHADMAAGVFIRVHGCRR